MTSMSRVTVRTQLSQYGVRLTGQVIRTVDRVVANGVPDLLHDALPAHVLRVPGVRDDPAELVVVVVVLPAVDSTANADVLLADVRARRTRKR